MTVRSPDFRGVVPTADEIAAHVQRAGRKPAVHRSECRKCGTRIWHSGLAVGSHRRACPGVPMATRDAIRADLPVGEVRTVAIATYADRVVVDADRTTDNDTRTAFTGTVLDHLSNSVVIEGAPFALPYTAIVR